VILSSRSVTGAVALAPESAEPDAGLGPRASAHQTDGLGFQRDAEDLADRLEVFENEVMPIVITGTLAIPGAGLFLGRIGQFRELIHRGFDDLSHGTHQKHGRENVQNCCGDCT
jgi:hypothetical protein